MLKQRSPFLLLATNGVRRVAEAVVPVMAALS